MKQTLYTLMIDQQDGGYTMYLYSSKEARDEERMKMATARIGEDEEPDMDDEYENGYPGEQEIEFTIDENGKLKFDEMSFHVGQ